VGNNRRNNKLKKKDSNQEKALKMAFINDRCSFTRGSRGEVMIFFEKNKVLGVEPNRVLNILEGI
jgi:hypothetical protein